MCLRMHRLRCLRRFYMTTALVLTAAVLIAGADQLIKYFIYQGLYPDGRVTVIDNLFSLVYSENRGAAFGVLQNGTLLFIFLTAALIVVFLYILISKKMQGKLFNVSVALIIGGGIGNLIDRLFRGFVIDYLSVSFFPPICNFADYCITVGAVLFILSILLMPDNSKKRAELPEREEENE